MPRPRDGSIGLWLVDDTPDHHDTVRATLEASPAFVFTGFTDAHQAIADYRRLAGGDDAHLPRIVLMDFYLGDWRGDVVTRELRLLQPTAARLTIVGYSSVASGSARILSAGGDLVVRKVRDQTGRNPQLALWLQQYLRAD